MIQLTINETVYILAVSVANDGEDLNLSLQQSAVNLSVEQGVTILQSEGNSNFFIQQTDPALQTPYVWFETHANGGLKTIWVNT